MKPLFYSLGQCLSLDSCVYYVRAVSRSGPGRMFYSLEIATKWAIQRQAETGVRHEIQERLAP